MDSILSKLMRLKFKLRTQGNVQGVLIKGHLTALEALVH
jgi:hypothetical protein